MWDNVKSKLSDAATSAQDLVSRTLANETWHEEQVWQRLASVQNTFENLFKGARTCEFKAPQEVDKV